MVLRNAALVCAAAVLGSLALYSTTQRPIQHSLEVASAKTDRLDGSPTETAFLPERFGVPSSTQ